MRPGRPRVAASVEALAGRLTRRSPRVERALLVVAAVVFVAATAAAVANLPPLDPEPAWAGALAVAVAALAVSVGANAWEFATSAWLVGHRMGGLEALRVSLLGTAANLLPVPGAALVRSRALRQLGTRYRHVAGATVAVAGLWVAVGLGAGALGVALVGRWELAGGALVVAVGAAVAGALLLPRVPGGPSRARATARLLAVEVASVGAAAVRLGAVLWLVAGVDPPGGLVLAASGVVATAAGLVPGGIGLRELLSALAGPAVGVTPAVAVFVSAVDRLLTYAVLAVAAGWVVARARPDQPPAGTGQPPADTGQQGGPGGA